MGKPKLVGPAGSGQVAKLCNQLIVGATINVVAEALLLAQAAGADPEAVREAIRGGFAGKPCAGGAWPAHAGTEFRAGRAGQEQLKDMHNVLAAAAAAGGCCRVTAW